MGIESATEPLVILALGRPEVRVRGVVVTLAWWQTRAARDLLLCLLEHSQGLSKEEIGLLLWPDSSQHQLHARFKNTIYRLRRAVGRDVILWCDGCYRVNPDLTRFYDVAEFLRHVQNAHDAADPQQRRHELEAALDLYRGPYLTAVEAFWILTRREALRQRFLEAGLLLGDLHLQAGRPHAALRTCYRMLESAPDLEAAHRLAMRAHAANGNRAEIMRQFGRCRATLWEEASVEPSNQTISLLEQLLS